MFKTFLICVPKAVTLWTDGKFQRNSCDSQICCPFRETFLPILYFVCNYILLKDILPSKNSTYYMKAVIIAEGGTVRPLLSGIRQGSPFVLEFSRGSGNFKLTLFNEGVNIQDQFQVKTLKILPNNLENLTFCGT